MRTFMHPAVKVVFITILIALTIAAVMYALRADPAPRAPEQPGAASLSVPAVVPSPSGYVDTITR